ncbi:hypothetical protein AGLY_001962 [Aphis glycines]|uniref:Uncharacterized protein n=1 Tax=Aphis glycines TaxID=307491 RepID=A0A6G0U3Z2_APHGL|nr:hypothetical protein AGLY_001962 [Aphis glycines]
MKAKLMKNLVLNFQLLATLTCEELCTTFLRMLTHKTKKKILQMPISSFKIREKCKKKIMYRKFQSKQLEKVSISSTNYLRIFAILIYFKNIVTNDLIFSTAIRTTYKKNFVLYFQVLLEIQHFITGFQKKKKILRKVEDFIKKNPKYFENLTVYNNVKKLILSTTGFDHFFVGFPDFFKNCFEFLIFYLYYTLRIFNLLLEILLNANPPDQGARSTATIRCKAITNLGPRPTTDLTTNDV